MKQSQLFTKTRREPPSDEVAKNAQLLIRAGYIHKEMAGVYAYLPLGLRVLNNVSRIIREEMNAIGGIEIQMTALQDKEKWVKSNRWDDAVVDVWFKTALKNDAQLGLGFTHDEALIDILKNYIASYKDLPRYIYQIQTKFRNELRSKSGIMRGREFLMKDLYSFTRTQQELDAFYEKVQRAYHNVFRRCGIGDSTYLTFSSGGTFSQFSHEFQTISDAGEDVIYVDQAKKIAVNKDVLNDEVLKGLGLTRSNLVEKKAIEVGNIFRQGTRFTDALGVYYADEKGERQSLYMGGYGIGVSRVVGTIVEVLADDKGLVWPKEVAPFAVHLIAIAGKSGEKVSAAADNLYADLEKAGVEVLYDDRDVSAGGKLADADLIGIPTRIVISEKTLEKDSVEVKERASGETKMVALSVAIDHFA